jgi:hypothetical protein
MKNREQIERIATEVSKRVADDGRLIEAGWTGYRVLVLPADASAVQIDECRMAFMAGSQHLFSSLMNILDPGEAETQGDIHKMELIERELRVFGREMEQRITGTKGSA